MAVGVTVLLVLIQFTATPVTPTHGEIAQKMSFPLLVHPFCSGNMLSFEKVPGAVKYQVLRSDGKSEQAVVKTETKENIVLDSGDITEGTEYTYMVAALDENGKELCKSMVGKGVTFCSNQDCALPLKYQIGNFMYWVGGKQEGPMNAAPEISNGRMFLVIRYVTAEVGAEIEWDGTQKKVTIKTWTGGKIELWIEKPDAMIDGKIIAIDSKNPDVVPYIKNGRTMLPMRFIAENLGCKKIDWNAETQSATLNMTKPNCTDDQMLPLTADTIDLSKSLMVCSTSFGAKVDVQLSDDAKASVKQIKAGQRVLVQSGIAATTDSGLSVTAKDIQPIDIDGSEKVLGILKSVGSHSIEVTDCSGAIKSLKWGLSNSDVKSIPLGIQLWLFVHGDSVVDFSVVSLEQPCKGGQTVSRRVKVLEPDCKNGRARCLGIGESEKDQILYVFSDSLSVGFCDIKADKCYAVLCAFDQFYRPLLRLAQESGCPCDFAIKPESDSINVPKGEEVELLFSVTNLEKEEKMIKVFSSGPNLSGKVTISPDFAYIKPNATQNFALKAPLDKDFLGQTTLKIGATCGETLQTKEISINVFEPQIELLEPFGILSCAKEDPISFKIVCRNKSQFAANCKASIEVGRIPINWSIRPVAHNIPADSFREYDVLASWDKTATPGTSHEIDFVVTCGSTVVTKKIKLSVKKGGPIVMIEKAVVDEEGVCMVSGRIDWKIYEKKSIVIEWGDTNSDIVQALPAKHKYEKKGIYTIKVMALSKTGESGEAQVEVLFEGVKPEVNVTRMFMEKYGKIYTLHVEGKVDWKGLQKERISFDWGDGKSNNGEFPQLHDYNGAGKYRITITAIATTGEEGDVIFTLTIFDNMMVANTPSLFVCPNKVCPSAMLSP